MCRSAQLTPGKLIGLAAAASVLVGGWIVMHHHEGSSSGGVSAQSNANRLKSGGHWSAADPIAIRHEFRIIRGPEEEIPSSIEASLAGRGSSQRPFHSEGGHLIHTRGGDVWIIPGDSRGLPLICLAYSGTGAISCAPSRQVVRFGIGIGIVANADHPNQLAPDFMTIGIAPDWVDAVRVRYGDTVRRLSVHSNTYAMRARAPIVVEGLCRRDGSCLRPSSSPAG
jgi:hypothetical protein